MAFSLFFFYLKNLTICLMLFFFESAHRVLSVKIIWQSIASAMEQRERFQGDGRQSWGCKAGCSSLLCPSPSLKFLPSTPSHQLATGSGLILHTHVFGTWGEEVEEGEWECNSRLGSAEKLQSKKIDESSRRWWEGLLRAETGSIYIPTLCLPGQFWLCSLPYHAGVSSVWNVLVTWMFILPWRPNLQVSSHFPVNWSNFVFHSVLTCLFTGIVSI